MKTTEIRPLTSLRFVAALMVFLHHYAGYSFGVRTNNLFTAVMAEGYLGVTLFFVLSGFLITLRYFVNPETQRWQPGEYFARRIARIWPLYYVLLILFVLIPNQQYFVSTGTVVFATLSQGYFMTYVFSGIPTAWSLSVEETFYLLAPLLFWFYRKLCSALAFQGRKPLAILTEMLVLLTVLFGVLGVMLQQVSIATGGVHEAGFLGGSGIEGASSILYTTIFFRIFEFSIGIWGAVFYSLYLKSRWWQRPDTKWMATALCLASVGGIAVAAYLLNHFGGIYNPLGRWFNYPAAVCMGALIVSLTREGTLPYRLLSTRLPVYLGRISYGLYLVQMLPPVIAPLEDLATTIGIVERTGLRFVVFMYTGMSIICAILYETVEKYGGKLVMWAYHHVPQRAVTKNLVQP